MVVLLAMAGLLSKRWKSRMPRRRQPREIWRVTRLKVWQRDNGKCQHCKEDVALDKCHVDHIQSGKNGTNHLSNLRTLCPVCHALRADHRHKGMFAKMLRNGLLPKNWRDLVWE